MKKLITENSYKKIVITKNSRGKRIRISTVNKDPSMTDQSMAPMTDVNNIIKQWLRSGKNDEILKQRAGQYADLSNITDLGDALMKIKRSEETFMTLPAKLRDKFQNDPQNFINYLQDSRNDEEAIKLGFKTVKKKDVPVSTEPDVDKPKARQQKKQPNLPLEE